MGEFAADTWEIPGSTLALAGILSGVDQKGKPPPGKWLVSMFSDQHRPRGSHVPPFPGLAEREMSLSQTASMARAKHMAVACSAWESS